MQPRSIVAPLLLATAAVAALSARSSWALSLQKAEINVDDGARLVMKRPFQCGPVLKLHSAYTGYGHPSL